jgi:tetratricopeptide (TPR) repeat protein
MSASCQVRLGGVVAGLLVLACTTTAGEPPPKPDARLPWQRLLRGEDARRAGQLQARINDLAEAGKYAEAVAEATALAALRERLQGGDHWQTVDARQQVRTLRRGAEFSEAEQADYRRSDQAARAAWDLYNRGDYARSQPLFEEALALRRRLLGEDHPDTAISSNNLALSLQSQGKHAEAEEYYRKSLALRRRLLGEDHPFTATGYENLALNRRDRGQYAEAEEGCRKALDLRRKLLGEEHLDTALGYNNLALTLDEQAKYPEAEDGYRKALALFRKLAGEGDPRTITAYSNLAVNLDAQGRYAEAEEGCRKALDLRRRLVGDEHPDTATAYNNLAYTLEHQGRYAEAEEACRKALALYRKRLGEEHPLTATGYDNLSLNLQHQGRYAEAEGGFRKALDLRRQLLGEQHPDTATSYNNLAENLEHQDKYAEAEEGFRKALAVYRGRLAEDHPLLATAINNLASSLDDQGKDAEAEECYRKALDLRRRRLGEDHPATATCQDNLAYSLYLHGKYAEAEEVSRKALDLRRRRLGEGHPLTAVNYENLACCLAAQGRDREAVEPLGRAADTLARARPGFAASGLGGARALNDRTPLPLLAVLLARHGEPEEAWRRFEQALGRGTWGDLDARLARSPQDRSRLAEAARRLERLDQLLGQSGTPQQHREWLDDRLRTQDELDALTHELARKHGLGAAQALPLEKVQAALPPDTALLGWADVQPRGKVAEVINEHWAVLLRARGGPAWVRLPGTGPGGAWTGADTRLAADLLTALRARRQAGPADWRPLAERLYRQRLGPLEPHLAATTDLPAVRRLVVLPSAPMDGIPPGVLTDRYVCSRAPSATVFAFLRGREKPRGDGLLALADPVFEPSEDARPTPAPPGGLLLTAVAPGSGAARAGLRPGDVLLRYRDTPLNTAADLRPPAAAGGGAPVPVRAWRAGETFTAEVAPGPLAVSVADEPAPEALARRRRIDAEVFSRCGDGPWPALPGTRVEAVAIARRFERARQPRRLLTDSDASEQRLYELARDGSLGGARYLHLATHGTVDRDIPLRSALLLSRDRLPDGGKQLDAGLPVFDGRLTAAEVLRDWDLDAELVTLSACETGLGHHAHGEGYLGFAQALLISGSRSVVLSLWQVNDAATALLMDRFYANLLGQREGLAKPLGKAAALAEAQQWLRTLPRSEAVKRAAALTGGVERGAGRQALPRAPAVPETAHDEPPYAHPYYWAAFVLVGDPG